jgi:hypothetical protein
MSRLSQIQHIEQEEAMGSSLACIAMILGLTYAEVKTESEKHSDLRIHKYGHYRSYWQEWLYRHDFADQCYTPYDARTNLARPIWPLALWADVHICSIKTETDTHLVLVKRDGTVYDPMRAEPSLWSEYPEVIYMSGIFDVTAHIEPIVRQ